MNGNVMLQLILKDWRLQRRMIILSILAGGIALAILQMKGQTPIVLGIVFFFISIIFCACLLPITNIVNERKKQTLAFLMSLPISSSRYGTAKLLSTFGMFLVPWLILVGAGLYLVLGRHVLPHGVVPVMLILANLPFIGFCLIAGVALVSESEGWGNAAVAVVSSSYWLAWYLLVSEVPSLSHNWAGPVAVWSPAAVRILVTEFVMILAILGVTLYVQSRKRDFI
ncbi:MAG TPA: ABC-2 transporter permease [Candidatus Acidoferrum sp.]|nr:ABC-2 transporter permease [Candidatus Acidoferrum sp.]